MAKFDITDENYSRSVGMRHRVISIFDRGMAFRSTSAARALAASRYVATNAPCASAAAACPHLVIVSATFMWHGAARGHGNAGNIINSSPSWQRILRLRRRLNMSHRLLAQRLRVQRDGITHATSSTFFALARHRPYARVNDIPGGWKEKPSSAIKMARSCSCLKAQRPACLYAWRRPITRS